MSSLTLLRGVVLTAAFASAAGAASAENLADAMVKAYLRDPGLASDRLGVKALDEVEFRARAEAFGTVTGDADYSYRSVEGAPSQGRGTRRVNTDPLNVGVTGSIPIYTGGQIENATQAAREGVNAARSRLIASEQNVLLNAVTAYEDVRQDISLVDVARSNVRLIGEQLRATRDRFEVGEVTRTDVSQAEARLAAARSTLAQTTGQLARSRQAYLVAIGELPPELDAPPPLPQLPASEAAAIALAESNHPSLRAARIDVRQAEFDIKEAIGATLPVVDIRGDARYGNADVFTDDGSGEQNSLQIGVRGTVPIWTGGRNPSFVRQSQATYAQRQSDVHNIARSIRQEVSVAWSDLEVSRISIVAAREEVRANQIAFEGVREESLVGARTTLDVLDAEQELQESRADLIIALRNEYVSGYRVLAAVGNLTVAHLGLNVPEYNPDDYRRTIENDRFNYPRDETTEWATAIRP